MFAAAVRFAVAALLFVATTGRTVLVTGATGRTGKIVYATLKQQGVTVRALVRNVDNAKTVLNCSKCDASEGIYVGDVTQTSTLVAASKGVDTVAVCIGLSGNESRDTMKAVEWKGLENQVAALSLANPSTDLSKIQVMMVSSMGTTNPKPAKFEGGEDLFWKLQGETFLATSGVGYTIIKPCGLLDSEGGKSSLVVGHDDFPNSPLTMMNAIAREDVAAVMTTALMNQDLSMGLRFDLCTNKVGKPTTDLKQLIIDAKWTWKAGL